ncbi:hypothetical protein COW36_24605 [bacterium (Candidatus Blackallbacteria) CG17_big_fil_post_rev_8_21_14_2_50_48_46]|uniref:O-antigen ligase-related domain-containing protein n=1 Tax=bacterium (Candidatus Blackallbacteria) CG17_big_fil_post_rev_8_21_14_2_50_48_46 TaxID=2014261 RepID=A0A2M7FX71_9BACT|nr:MAG: hypothetical protein COW64_19545 [bacterium (Candidatus Blackallbacteria) CG18_big_fil_WC_8_21_14_2_50_49_26]PIW13850.1 MAG: hypothetical protein COW36_24605 [bacterium (Candidatus Blackallbacteria) CG17_big_fil_post_rev_8_21_14_2_50_48_46]PIW45076.1 MAG: hypothetical protein COW20_22235 [bacterium (Candidatus Blackallbacteria) CG13_big_fil_rev_8_21_14_2_50_49_14]
MRTTTQTYLIPIGLILLLFWSALEYGGRYLYGQTLAQTLTGGMVLLFVLHQIRTQTAQNRYPLILVTGLWFGALVLAWIFSINRLASLEELLRYLMYLLLPLLLFFNLKSQRMLNSLSLALVFAALTICAIGWLNSSGQDSKLTSTFNRTNDLAGYLIIVIPLALHLTLTLAKTKSRLFLGAISAILTSSLIVTQSRSSWLACLVSLLILAYFHRDKFKRPETPWLGGVMLLLILGGTALKWDHLAPRIQTLLSLSILQENATAWRLALLKGAWQIFLDFPILGTGPNTFSLIYPSYQNQLGYYSINPHNYYLQILAETGFFGFLAALLYIVYLMRTIKKTGNPLMPGVIAGLSASLFHTGFDIDWSVSAIPIIFFFLAGLGLAKPQEENDENFIPSPKAPASKILFQSLGLFAGLALMILPTMNQSSANAFAEAASAHEQNDKQKAQAALEKAIRLAPWPSGRHHALAAQIELEKKNYSKGLALIVKAMELDRYNTEYMKIAADLLIILGKNQEAETLLNKRIQTAPFHHPSYYSDLGDFLWQNKKPEQAYQWYIKGSQIFTDQKLKRYEHYTPSHRFQLFMLYQRLAQLSLFLKKTKEGETFASQAQDLLKNAGADMFVTSGLNNPIQAINHYWKNLRNDSIKLSLRPEIDIPAPGTDIEIKPQEILFLEAKRNIFSASLVYTLPIRPKGKQNWSLLYLHDDLQGTSDGWKIVNRMVLSPIKKP